MKVWMAATGGLALAASAQVIDNTATRVQTTLDPGLKRIATLAPKCADEIGSSRWTLGCERIDREYSDYDAPTFITDKKLLSVMPILGH